MNAPPANWPEPLVGGVTELLVVRHGETQWNRERRLQGQMDLPLSATGEAQARSLAARLEALAASLSVAAVVSSDLKRAVDTAQPVAAVLGLDVRTDPRFRERHYGVFQGVDRDALQGRWPDLHQRWLMRDPDLDFQTGESLRVFQHRVGTALEDLALQWGGQRVVLVAHGGVMDALWRHVMNLPLQTARAWPLYNASLNSLRRDGSGGWTIHFWGDVAHLTGSDDDIEPIGYTAS